MHRGQSLYIVCQWDPVNRKFSHTAYNEIGQKGPAFRRLSIPDKDRLEGLRIQGSKQELFRCIHVTNAKSIPEKIRKVHEKEATYSHAKGVG